MQMMPPPDFIPPEYGGPAPTSSPSFQTKPIIKAPQYPNNHQEAYLLRLILKYGHFEVVLQNENYEEEKEQGIEGCEPSYQITVAQMIIQDIREDDLSFDNPHHQSIWETFSNKFSEGEIPTEKFFLQSSEADLVKEVIEITEDKYTLNDWKKHSIYVTTEEDKIKLAIIVALHRLKLGKIKQQISEINAKLESNEFPDEINELLTHLSLLNQAKMTLSKVLGRNI